jgi:hypothetical protein
MPCVEQGKFHRRESCDGGQAFQKNEQAFCMSREKKRSGAEKHCYPAERSTV